MEGRLKTLKHRLEAKCTNAKQTEMTVKMVNKLAN